ncbi:hypothetical protein HBI81_243490 [Parastagonospora nodorum]|nr:hypothetical protein HBI18_247860 [Parastagonospora nodorum]KAH6511579.1 hypothetical protein HBI81_243490 [Parastagonospora nodorum]
MMSVAIENKAGVPLPPPTEHQPQPYAASKSIQLPPSPPETVNGDDSKSNASNSEPDFALPTPITILTKTLDVNQKTLDAHVPRDPQLIRLTEVHPFNIEAPLTNLFHEVFLTSPELFYVRNHRVVPEVQDSESSSLKTRLQQLLEEYENVTYLITLVCASNRRKEQNVIRKSKRFSWGPASLSTTFFTGVVMKDIIERAKPLKRANQLNWVMDPNRGIMLAHGMNGEMLRPEHGKPLRAVIPGQIGGRSVKRLKKLIITLMTKDGVHKQISIDELRKHGNAENPEFIVNGEVYDGTAFLEGHPCGAQSIVGAAGLDALDEFLAIYSETAKAMMPDYHIGSLDEASRKVLAEREPVNESTELRPVFLDARIWNQALLHVRTPISWDTRIFTFKLDHEEQALGLREAIIRSYTPISQTSELRFCDVLIKVCADTQEKVSGKMTKALDAIPVGHFVDFEGPIGKFEYLGNGRCSINGKQRSVKKLYIVCGGSGTTPFFQILRAVIQDKNDPTHCTVLNGNRLVEDILCREDLDVFAREKPERCKLLYTLTKGPEDWEDSRGRIGKQLLGEQFGVDLWAGGVGEEYAQGAE